MAAPYSMDLRERVLKAWDASGAKRARTSSRVSLPPATTPPRAVSIAVRPALAKQLKSIDTVSAYCANATFLIRNTRSLSSATVTRRKARCSS